MAVLPYPTRLESIGVLAVHLAPEFSTANTTDAPVLITALIFSAMVLLSAAVSGVTTQSAAKETVPMVSFVSAVVWHFAAVEPEDVRACWPKTVTIRNSSGDIVALS